MLDEIIAILGILVVLFLAVLVMEIVIAKVCINKMLKKTPCSYEKGLEHEVRKGNFVDKFFEVNAYSEFKINSPNGYSLYGRYFLQTVPTKKTAVIMHGHAGNLIWSYKYAQLFQNMGYNWVLFDNRGCGNSGGVGYTMGFEESADLVEVIKFARKVVPGCEIVIHGESLGASTAILALDKDFGEDIACVVADCGFSSLTEEVKHQLKLKKLPWKFVGIFASLLAEIEYGFFFRNVSPIRVLQNGRFDVPILFVHGKEDKKTPCVMAEDMFEAYGGVKEIYLVENAGHASAFAVDGMEYERRVSEFCEKFVKGE